MAELKPARVDHFEENLLAVTVRLGIRENFPLKGDQFLRDEFPQVLNTAEHWEIHGNPVVVSWPMICRVG